MPDPWHIVLTGDIVGSKRLLSQGRELMLHTLKQAFERVAERRPGCRSEIFRGDSFQVFLPDPTTALAETLYIRTSLRAVTPPEGKALDARIGLGAGPAEYLVEGLAESDGTAFRLSGRALEKLRDNRRIALLSPQEELNAELQPAFVLLDALVDRWTPSQAEVVALTLSGYNQTRIGERLGVTQSAVNHRLRAARWEAVPPLLERFSDLFDPERRKPDHPTTEP